MNEKFFLSQQEKLEPRTSRSVLEGIKYNKKILILLAYIFDIFNIIIYNISRTLTAVYDALLEDLVYPVEIVGKRTRVKLDGSQVIKVHLDRNEQTNIEHKVY